LIISKTEQVLWEYNPSNSKKNYTITLHQLIRLHMEKKKLQTE